MRKMQYRSSSFGYLLAGQYSSLFDEMSEHKRTEHLAIRSSVKADWTILAGGSGRLL